MDGLNGLHRRRHLDRLLWHDWNWMRPGRNSRRAWRCDGGTRHTWHTRRHTPAHRPGQMNGGLNGAWHARHARNARHARHGSRSAGNSLNGWCWPSHVVARDGALNGAPLHWACWAHWAHYVRSDTQLRRWAGLYRTHSRRRLQREGGHSIGTANNWETDRLKLEQWCRNINIWIQVELKLPHVKLQRETLGVNIAVLFWVTQEHFPDLTVTPSTTLGPLSLNLKG